jgi:hypothetical protein
MALQKLSTAQDADRRSGLSLAHVSGVSWSAVLAGATGAAALSLILLLLGIGLGLSSISPWVSQGVSAKALSLSAILWITITQLLASGMGGYLAGRLRTRWAGIHTDEVYFRDTAHGFLAWAVATIATAALLTSTIGSIVSGGAQAGAAVAGGAAAAGATAAGPRMGNPDAGPGAIGYFVDSLFRKDMNAPQVSPPIGGNPGVRPLAAPPEQPSFQSAGEVNRIFMNTVRSGPLSPEDARYAGQLVAQRTGLSQQDAEKRVTDTYAKVQAKLHDAEATAKKAADKARKASAYTALWLFISLLIGAFVASLTATCGGRCRDADQIVDQL